MLGFIIASLALWADARAYLVEGGEDGSGEGHAVEIQLLRVAGNLTGIGIQGGKKVAEKARKRVEKFKMMHGVDREG